MSRSGYTDDYCDDNWAMIRYAGALKSAMDGKKGQAFFKDLVKALDEMPEKKLITGDLIDQRGNVCALGAVGKSRNMDMIHLNPDDSKAVAQKFGIAESLARDVVYMNDEFFWNCEPFQRFHNMRNWALEKIKKDLPASSYNHQPQTEASRLS